MMRPAGMAGGAVAGQAPERASAPAGARPARATGSRRWLAFRRNRLAVLGGLIVLLFAVAALAAPVLPLPNPDLINTRQRLSPPLTLAEYALGTDELGRDMLSRLVWGARISLLMGVASAIGALIVGGTLGLVSGYRGGLVDQTIMRLMDVLMAFPFILLAIALVAALGPGLFNAMLAIAIVGVPYYARTVRASSLVVREQEYVLAARTVGATDPRILRRYLAPNIVGPVLVLFTLDVGAKIIATASLSFLGLGAQPPTADWGNMLANGRQYLAAAWWVATLPGLAIFAVVLAFNLLGDGLRDVLDPRALSGLDGRRGS
jgi:peptide/nickel transport system permease protein